MNRNDTLILEQRYQMIILEGSISTLLDNHIHEMLQEGIWGWDTVKGAALKTSAAVGAGVTAAKQQYQQASQMVSDFASLNISDIQMFGTKLIALGKFALTTGITASIFVYIVGSVINYVVRNRKEADQINIEKVMLLADVNTRKQIAKLAADYEKGDEKQKKAVIQKQTQILNDAVKTIRSHTKDEKNSQTLTSIMSAVGSFIHDNNVKLSLIIIAILSHFNLIHWPKLIG